MRLTFLLHLPISCYQSAWTAVIGVAVFSATIAMSMVMRRAVMTCLFRKAIVPIPFAATGFLLVGRVVVIVIVMTVTMAVPVPVSMMPLILTQIMIMSVASAHAASPVEGQKARCMMVCPAVDAYLDLCIAVKPVNHDLHAGWLRLRLRFTDTFDRDEAATAISTTTPEPPEESTGFGFLFLLFLFLFLDHSNDPAIVIVVVVLTQLDQTASMEQTGKARRTTSQRWNKDISDVDCIITVIAMSWHYRMPRFELALRYPDIHLGRLIVDAQESAGL